MDRLDQDIFPGRILHLPDEHFNLDNVIVVTGAGQGVGRAAAIAAAANNIMTVGLDSDPLEGNQTQELAREMGGQMIFIHTDLTSDQSCRRAVKEASKLGAIKYLVNAPEFRVFEHRRRDAADEFSMAAFDAVFRMMVRTSIFLSHLVIPHMKNSADGAGVIGNIAGWCGHADGCFEQAAYISQMSLRAFSRCITCMDPGALRSFTICPGLEGPGDSIGRSSGPVDDIPRSGGRHRDGQWDEPSPLGRSVDIANLVMIGLSCFGKYLAEGNGFFRSIRW